ncbi:hypothetical protein DSO57_1026742 [Entomophthora muscae]|uniref:Uncharacterized protein n=1 Tax=Entomophthora muscae TaxID=34485 RepID=A0ACC2RGR7_9FUNG|nr:hypothetical protein DSO57_1026742 [Entomophthora muscae]
MKEIPTAPPFPDAPPTQDFSKLGFVYIAELGLAYQVVPHTRSWRPLATALNYLVCIAPIVYMALQARPASPVGVQPDSGMGRDTYQETVQGSGGLHCTEASVMLTTDLLRRYHMYCVRLKRRIVEGAAFSKAGHLKY